MPKATKKKRDKQADFAKVKLKLGKGKQAPSNATDTSFKARSIALPGQNVLNRALANADGSISKEPTTSQGLTLEDISVRLRHPNAGVKRDALTGLKEILGLDPGREVGKVLRTLGALVCDEDPSVRKALIALLGWYLEQLSESILSPHLSLLVLQVSSALSHIFPEIRLDGCRLVQLLLNHVPSHVIGSWPREPSNILEGLRLAVGLGGEKGVNTQIGRLTGAAKLVTIRAMAEFVRCGLGRKTGEQGDGDDSLDIFKGWIEGSKKGSGAKVKTVSEAPTVDNLAEEGWLVGMASPAAALTNLSNDWELGRLTAEGDADSDDNAITVISQLFIQLHPLLLSTFLESAPTAFSPSQTTSSSTTTEDIHLSLCSTTATLTGLLARAILGVSTSTSASSEYRQVRGCVSDFLKRMAGWFPFRSPRSSALTPSGIPPAFELSLVYAELAVLLAPRPPTLSIPIATRRETAWRSRVRAVEDAWDTMREQENKAKGKGKGKAGADHWAMEEVAEWIVDILAPTKDALAQPLTSAAYRALLPIIWALLVRPPPSSTENIASLDTASEIGNAFLSHLSRQASTSTLRAIGDQFLIAIITIHEQQYPKLPFYIKSRSELRPLIGEWMEGLPKILWELGNRDERATDRLIRFLSGIGLRGSFEKPFSLIDVETFRGISERLAPFYHIHHPSKKISSPWNRLSSNNKKLALDLAKVWIEWDTPIGDGNGKLGKLGNAVREAVEGNDDKQWENYWRR